MKLSLVVMTDGKSKDKVIQISLPQFIIGRDPECQLRPASALISKRHCAILTKDGKAFVRDFESTNGTLVNDVPIKGEVELKRDDMLKVGPLLFKVHFEATPAGTGTPPPASSVSKKPSSTPPPQTKAQVESAEDDSIAAMLLSLQEDGPDGVPEGSTVMDILTSPGETQIGDPNRNTDSKAAPLKPKPAENTSVAAKAILEKYMRRPRA